MANSIYSEPQSLAVPSTEPEIVRLHSCGCFPFPVCIMQEIPGCL